MIFLGGQDGRMAIGQLSDKYRDPSPGIPCNAITNLCWLIAALKDVLTP